MAHTPHKLAIVAITHADNRARVKGFREAIRKAFDWDRESGQHDAILWHVEDAPVYIPDSYIVDEEERLIRVYEVEDTHALESEKLEYYLSFACSIDADTTDWEFELVVTDRYGTLDRLIPIENLVGAGNDLNHPRLQKVFRASRVETRKCYRCNRIFSQQDHTNHLKDCICD